MSYRELKEIFPSNPSTRQTFSLSLSDHYQLDSTSHTTWLVSQVGTSVTAGLIASLITQPADVIKTYRQVAPTDYQNVYVTIKSIIKV